MTHHWHLQQQQQQQKNSDPLKAEEGNVTVCVYVLDKTNKMAFEVNRDKAIEGYVAPAT